MAPPDLGLMCLQCGWRGAAADFAAHKCPVAASRALEALFLASVVIAVVVYLWGL